MNKYIGSIFSLLLFFNFSYAQNTEYGNWLIYFGDVKTQSRWNWHHEIQYRNFNLIGDIDQILLRTGIGYNLTENNHNIHLGYGYIYNESYRDGSDSKISSSENRIYQQFITRQSSGRFYWQHRYRFEQRFFKDDFRLRLRYFLSLNVALNKKEMIDHTIYLSMYNEIFMQTEGSYFDRNRLYGGLGYRWNSRWRAEMGWMQQALANTSRSQLNLIMFVQL
jgi:hypothetical protein